MRFLSSLVWFFTQWRGTPLTLFAPVSMLARLDFERQKEERYGAAIN